MELPKSARAAARAVWRRIRRDACLCTSLRCTSSCPTYCRTCHKNMRCDCALGGVLNDTGIVMSGLYAAIGDRAGPACILHL